MIKMAAKHRRLPTIHLVRRKSAERYMLLTLLCFAGSVALTRLFLSLTGYPQIGKGELHIAHVLWGGILLYLAALVLLIFSNRGVYLLGSVLAGTGVGLFIDEVGKFITQSNNYFYPIAAPLIYLLFLVSLLALVRVRRLKTPPRSGVLSQALDDIAQSFDKKFSGREWDGLKSDLHDMAEKSESPELASLAHALVRFVDSEPDNHVHLKKSRHPAWQKLDRALVFLLSPGFLKYLLIAGLFIMGLFMWKNPISVLTTGTEAGRLGAFLDSLRFGRQILPLSALGWFELRVVLELVTGLLLILAAFMLIPRRNHAGIILGIFGLLMALTTVDVLLFYFEQFSTIVTATFHFIILLGLYHYRDDLKLLGRPKESSE